MGKMRATFKSSPRHEKVKKGDRIRKKAKANFEEDNKEPRYEFKVSDFKGVINSGLYCIIFCL